MGLVPSKYLPKKNEIRDVQVRESLVIWGVNGVGMDWHGLTLRENEAAGSGKVFKYVPGLRDTIFISKMPAEGQTSKK